ncbi:antifreeze protein [Jannaschia sp. S6380]|uniref:antifreeze protein n=1 Tax=Jannaschia sp. S6380 TaxID=2926408 RepID=UPI001FF4D6F8|nr:antifreeze protein [Jannaschia sp. S6380]MCK0166848.1 antifreeze protein [Jannaschia sp. S6380]
MLELLRLQMRTTQMLIEAQTVIGLRVMGMAGGSAAPGENLRMITEKQTAFAQSGLAAMGAVLSGKTPAQTYGLALTPIGRTTRANSRRLAHRR